MILGGGRKKFYPVKDGGERLDGQTLVDDWKNGKASKSGSYKYVENKVELLAAVADKTENIFGLFHDSHMDYHILAKETQPTLEDMTEAAIKVLSTNEKGFFLFVEGGFHWPFSLSFLFLVSSTWSLKGSWSLGRPTVDLLSVFCTEVNPLASKNMFKPFYLRLLEFLTCFHLVAPANP